MPPFFLAKASLRKSRLEASLPETKSAHPGMRASTVHNVVRLLVSCGYSDEEISYGLDYAEAEGARTAMECFTLAVSRLIYSDDQLAAKMRFIFTDVMEANRQHPRWDS